MMGDISSLDPEVLKVAQAAADVKRERDALHEHIDRCPLGWHNGQVIHTRMTTEEDVLKWLQKLVDLRNEATKQTQRFR